METKSIKSDINCILDNYERQVKELVSEAQSLSNELDNVQNIMKKNFIYLFKIFFQNFTIFSKILQFLQFCNFF